MTNLDNSTEVDLNKLKTVDQLKGSIKDHFTREEILELVQNNTIPYYILKNPVTNKETVLFNPDDLKAYIQKQCITHYKPSFEQKIDFLYFNYEDKKPGLTDTVPPELSRIKNLYKLPIESVATPPGIYFLCQDHKIVYIGQATNIGHRIATHLTENTKQFNRCLFYNLL